IGANVARSKRLGNLPQVGDGKTLMGQASLRSVQNGEVLYGLSMAIFETAKGEPALRQLPAFPDRRQGVRRRPVAFLKTIQRKRPCAGLEVRQFFNSKIFWILFENHEKEAIRRQLPAAARQVRRWPGRPGESLVWY